MFKNKGKKKEKVEWDMLRVGVELEELNMKGAQLGED